MTDKERLEEIKDYFKKILDEKINVNPYLNADDISFLIGQAKRVHLLEKQVASERAHKLTYRKVAQRYQSERNRYREALEKIKDNSSCLVAFGYSVKALE